MPLAVVEVSLFSCEVDFPAVALSYFSNVSLTLGFHGVSSDASFEAISLICVKNCSLKKFLVSV